MKLPVTVTALEDSLVMIVQVRESTKCNNVICDIHIIIYVSDAYDMIFRLTYNISLFSFLA